MISVGRRQIGAIKNKLRINEGMVSSDENIENTENTENNVVISNAGYIKL